MKKIFPKQIEDLPVFAGPFNAFQLSADECKVLFASYPGGTKIPGHRHDTDNIGVITEGELVLTMYGITKKFGVGEWYHVPTNAEHSAWFDVDSAAIEFWFDAND